MSLLEQVQASLAARTGADPRDGAAAGLAELYARTIDANPADSNVLARLGPKLFTVLSSLGLTLEARGSKPPEEPTRDRPAADVDPIDELEQRRAERAARQHPAQDHDPATGDRAARTLPLSLRVDRGDKLRVRRDSVRRARPRNPA